MTNYFNIGEEVKTEEGRVGFVVHSHESLQMVTVILFDTGDVMNYPANKVIRPKSYRHPKAEIIMHWIHGGRIQYRTRKNAMEEYKYDWKDWVNGFSMTPNFSSDTTEYRITPVMVTRKFRIGMTKDKELKIYFEEPTLEDAYGLDAFSRWVTPNWEEFTTEA